MSKKKKSSRAPAARRRREQQKSNSLVIPVLVGLVLLVVVVVVIASFENRDNTPTVGSIPTMTARPTTPIPYPDVPRVEIEEAQQRVAAGEAVLIDARSVESYQQSHIAGAISLPEADVEARLDELPRDVEWIFYCT